MTALSVAVLLLLGQLPPPQLAEPGPSLTLEADTAEVLSDEGVVRAEGNVLLQSGALRLRAGELEYDLEEREASASGGVLFIDGNLAVIADEGDFSAAGAGFSADGVELYQKDAGQGKLLLGAKDAAEARRVGHNALTLKAEHVEQLARGRYLARGLRMSPCDCGDGKSPDLEVAASSGDVEAGNRAVLKWSRIYVRGVPVLVLPAMYLPLTSRKTGFLLPRVGWSYLNGFSIDEPFFLTLGRSYDLTVSGGYRFGLDDLPLGPAGPPGMKGPRGAAEFRYAPAERTAGRLYIAAIDDLQDDLNGTQRGWRGGLNWRHASQFGDGFGLRSDVNLVSDTQYLGAETLFALEAPPYLRSQVHADWRSANAAAILAGSWYQNLAEPGLVPGQLPRLFGPETPLALQRPIVAAFEVPQVAVAGALHLGGEVVVERYQPINADNVQRTLAADGLFALAGQPPTVAALNRVVVSPEFALPLVRSDGLVAEVYGRARGIVSAYEPTADVPGDQGWAVELAESGSVPSKGSTALRGRAVAGVFAGTELSRVYGEGAGALRHTIEPRIELRGLSDEWGDRPALADTVVTPVDEFDRVYPLVPSGPAGEDAQLQAIASVTTRLLSKRGEIGRLVLGQDVSMVPGELGDTFGQLALRLGILSVGTGARVDPQRGELVWFNGSARVDDRRGDALTLTFDHLRDARGTDRMRAGLDDLFRLAPELGEAATGSKLDQAVFNVQVKPLSWLAVHYGATLAFNIPPPPGASSAFEKLLGHAVAHVGGISLNGNCDCWRLDLVVAYVPGNSTPSVHFVFDLKNLGSFSG